jgi:hypothetical protein
VDVFWSEFPAAMSYELEVGSKTGLADVLPRKNVGNVTSVSGRDLPLGTYFVRVFANTPVGLSGSSNEKMFIKNGTCPRLPAPTNLAFAKVGPFLTLIWLGVDGARSHRLLVSGPLTLDSDVGSVQSVQYDVTGAPSGGYSVRVAGVDGCGVGDPSNESVILLP